MFQTLQKSTLLLLFATLAIGVASTPVAAQDWPTKTIKFVVPFTAGGANDLVARVAAEGVQKELKQPVIVDNRGGGGGVIGAGLVAKSPPDGYTFLVGAVGVVTNSFILKKMPYADSDLIPVSLLAVSPSIIVVNPSVPAKNLAEFVAYAKSKGDAGVDFATAGVGTTPHFVLEMLEEQYGIKLNPIPYKSGSEGVTAVMGGQVPATSESASILLAHIKTGKLVPIASTWPKRVQAVPDIPTAVEQGAPNVKIGHWAGMFAPKGTPEAIMQRMNAAVQKVIKSPETQKKLVSAGIEPQGGTQAEFIEFIKAERERLGALAKKANMQAD
jgi:tripartite-type tricarboxylate transporter receptor subunit TctC